MPGRRRLPALATVAVLAAALASGCGDAGARSAPTGDVLRLPVAPDRPMALAERSAVSPAAFAGDRVLLAHVDGREIRVAAIGRGGDAAGPALLTYRAPQGTSPSADLSASSRAVALVVTLRQGDDGDAPPVGAQLFIGPADGPLRAVGPLRRYTSGAWYPAIVQVDGERIFVTEHRSRDGSDAVTEARHRVRSLGGRARSIALPRTAVPHYAGRHVVYAVRSRRASPSRRAARVVVRDWRSGAIRQQRRIAGSVRAARVRADGTVAVLFSSPPGLTTRITVLRRGRAPLAVAMSDPFNLAWAGRSLIVHRIPLGGPDAEGLRVVEPSGRSRAFGVPTANLYGLHTDGRRVLWNGSGCVLAADVRARAAAAPDAGPCPRSEVIVDERIDRERQPQLGPDRIVPVPLRCLAAPPPGCTGRVDTLGFETEPTSFTIPTGTRRVVAVRLTERGYAAATAPDGGAAQSGFTAELTTTDPAGRATRTVAPVNVSVAP